MRSRQTRARDRWRRWVVPALGVLMTTAAETRTTIAVGAFRTLMFRHNRRSRGDSGQGRFN